MNTRYDLIAAGSLDLQVDVAELDTAILSEEGPDFLDADISILNEEV